MENTRESGFINSQPCIAEFMTDIPHINDTFRRSSITNDSRMPPFCQALNSSNQLPTDITTVNGVTASGTVPSVKVPEYPWMREKKPSRKPGLPPEPPLGPIGKYETFILKYS